MHMQHGGFVRGLHASLQTRQVLLHNTKKKVIINSDGAVCYHKCNLNYNIRGGEENAERLIENIRPKQIFENDNMREVYEINVLEGINKADVYYELW